MHAYSTPAPITAAVDVVFGDVRFIAADRADTTVTVEPVDPTYRLDVEAAERVETDFADGRLTVRHPKLRTALARKFGSVRVRVELPAGSDVRGDTAQGEYLVQGAVGSCRLTTAIGGIRVGTAADVRLRTSGGAVEADHITGRADIGANGDVHVRRVDGDAVVKNIGGAVAIDTARAAVTAKTATGNLRVGAIGAGPVELDTAIGAIEVGVPEGTAVRLDAKAATGRVRDEVGSAAGPGTAVKVRARCNGGDITIRRAVARRERSAA